MYWRVRMRSHASNGEDWHVAIYMALILLLFGYMLSLWNSDLEVLHQQSLSVDYGSNNNMLKISWKGGVDICHSDWHKVSTCNDQFSGSEWQRFFTKKSGCTILASLTVFEIVIATSIVLYNHQCCAASLDTLHCNTSHCHLSCITENVAFCLGFG